MYINFNLISFPSGEYRRWLEKDIDSKITIDYEQKKIFRKGTQEICYGAMQCDLCKILCVELKYWDNLLKINFFS